MISNTYSRYAALENSIKSDAEIQMLLKRLQEQETVFLKVCSRLCVEDRDILYEHLGICAEINQRIIEIACFRL